MVFAFELQVCAALLESNALLEKLVLNSMADSIELFKQYTDDNSFKAWLQQMIFDVAKEQVKEKVVV